VNPWGDEEEAPLDEEAPAEKGSSAAAEEATVMCWRWMGDKTGEGCLNFVQPEEDARGIVTCC
jgi:hypothetical protein